MRVNPTPCHTSAPRVEALIEPQAAQRLAMQRQKPRLSTKSKFKAEMTWFWLIKRPLRPLGLNKAPCSLVGAARSGALSWGLPPQTNFSFSGGVLYSLDKAAIGLDKVALPSADTLRGGRGRCGRRPSSAPPSTAAVPERKVPGPGGRSLCLVNKRATRTCKHHAQARAVALRVLQRRAIGQSPWPAADQDSC